MKKKFKKDSIVDSSKGIWVGERELDDDDELDGDTIGEAMARCGADSLTVGGTSYEPTKKDKNLTFREFMEKYDIDVAVVRERGTLRRCMGCDKTDVPFSDPYAMECRPCHRETCRRYRAKKKRNVEDEIRRLSSELEQLWAIVEDMRSSANNNSSLDYTPRHGIMGIFPRKSTNNSTSSRRLAAQLAAKIDGTPRQIGLPKQKEGLADQIVEYDQNSGEKFGYAVVGVDNPMTKEEMDNAMASADKGVKGKLAKKKVEHELLLMGAVTQISFGHLVKERHKKYKYVGMTQIIMIFSSSTSFAGNYWGASVQIVDDRLGEQEIIRGHDMDTNISLRIIMGIDFAIYEEDLYRIHIRVISGIKREEARWGSLKITMPEVSFYTGYRILPYTETNFKPVFSPDHLKERSRDPAFTASNIVQEDLNALKTLYEDGKIRDESRADDSGATRERYEGTQFEKKTVTRSAKNKGAIANYMARMEEERKNIPVGDDNDDEDVSSEARMRQFVEEEDGDSIASPPPTYREKRKSVGIAIDKSSDENIVPDVVSRSPRNSVIGRDSTDDPDVISLKGSQTDDNRQPQSNSDISRRFSATSNGSSGSGAPRPPRKMVLGPGKSILRTGDDGSVVSSGSRKKKMFKQRKSVTMDGIDEVE